MLTWHGVRREDLHAGSTDRRNGPVSCLEFCVVLRIVAVWQIEEGGSDRSSGSAMGTPSAKSCHRPIVFWFVRNMGTGELSHAQCGLQAVLRKSLLEDQGETGFSEFLILRFSPAFDRVCQPIVWPKLPGMPCIGAGVHCRQDVPSSGQGVGSCGGPDLASQLCTLGPVAQSLCASAFSPVEGRDEGPGNVIMKIK